MGPVAVLPRSARTAVPDRVRADGGNPGPILMTVALAAAVALTAWWGAAVDGTHLGAAPFSGTWDLRLGPELLVPVLVAAAVIAGSRRLTTLPWRRLLVATATLSAAWAVSLALTDGFDRLSQPLTTRWDYLAAVPLVGDPGRFLDRFVADLSSFPTHVRSHPPGTVLTLWSLDRIGLGGAGWAAALVIGAGAAATAAVLATFREVAGEAAARRTAPFVVLSPVALWVATSADALFLGVGATAVALLVLATGRSGWSSRSLAAAGGVAASGALFLSYGIVLLGIVPVAVAGVRRRPDVLMIGAVPVAASALALMGAGFSWWDGLTATRSEYWAGVASERPLSYFAAANLVVAATAAGPAVWGGLVRRPGGGTALIAGSALAAVLIADLSALSKGEVERIWLPFLPFLAVATATLPRQRRQAWLAATALTAIVLQVTLRSPW